MTNKRIELIKAAIPLTEDPAIIIPHQLYTLSVLKQLKLSLETIKDYDKHIAQWFGQHKDREVFESLPAAGAVMAPRLLAAFGSDRNRFVNADEVSKCTGISPVLKRSGKMKTISWRHQCSKFVRQTFVEWANLSIHASYWAKAYYDEQRDKGRSHQAVLRSLAFKWIRIIFSCWKNHTKYDEAAYLFALDRRHSEIKKS